VKYISLTRVLFIHDQLVKRFGGSLGVRDVSLLESALARPHASFDGEDLYPGIYEKAAALMHSLLKNHAFVDGKKRTALAATGIFLKLNDIILQNKHEEELQFALQVENESITLRDIAIWLENNSAKIETP
jgi:death-on-curing protein